MKMNKRTFWKLEKFIDCQNHALLSKYTCMYKVFASVIELSLCMLVYTLQNPSNII